MLNTIDDTLDWLFNQRNPIKDKKLDRIKMLINKLNLYPDYPIILITGTNGKGSTSCYLKDILKNTGRHVGIFTSPFVNIFNERIMINDRYISNAEIMHYTNILYELSNTMTDTIPFFELVLLISLMYFKDRTVDLGIFEVGIGGLYDATNALNPELSIITNIGFDHTNILGNTLEEIANHKLGIARNNKVLLTAENKISSYIENYCKNNNIIYNNVSNTIKDIHVTDKTNFKYKDISYSLSMLGEYQAYNASLAIEAAKLISNDITDEVIKYSILDSKIPGRFEVISRNPNIILDGAHNISAIKMLSNELKSYSNIVCLFSALKDKNYDLMLEELDKVVDSYIFVNIPDIRGVEANEFTKYTSKPCTVYKSLEELFNNLNLDSSMTLLVTGSLHFISLVKKHINK